MVWLRSASDLDLGASIASSRLEAPLPPCPVAELRRVWLPGTDRVRSSRSTRHAGPGRRFAAPLQRRRRLLDVPGQQDDPLPVGSVGEARHLADAWWAPPVPC